MSEFLDYIHKAEQEQAMTEEQRLAMHKKHKRIQENRKNNTFDDFYDELEPINEGIRVPPKRKPKVIQNDVQEIDDTRYCVPRPSKADYDETENDLQKYSNDAIVKRAKKSVNLDFNESYHQNPVLREAYNMMDEMKKKIEDMFYQYGMTGLEKLNESMLDVFEEILNPPMPEPVERIVEKVVEIPTPAPIKHTKKKTIKRKPTITKKQLIDEQKNFITENIDNISDELPESTNINMFDTLNQNVDLNKLGNCLTEQSKAQKQIESKTTQQLKKINANAELLQKAINDATKINEPEIENYDTEPSEEIEITDDDTDIDLNEYTTADTDNEEN